MLKNRTQSRSDMQLAVHPQRLEPPHRLYRNGNGKQEERVD